MLEVAKARGIYEFNCYGFDGILKWRRFINNVVTTVGKNVALDAYLSGAAYTVTGPFLGLISSTSFTGVSVNDTMSSHAGWLEAGLANNPTYSGTRPIMGFDNAASGSKATNLALTFFITSNGVIKGGFVVFGSGATAVKDSTAGTLYSAGLFVDGDETVVNTDIVNVAYTASL